MNRSAEPVALVPSDVVMVTSTVPAPSGETAVIEVPDLTSKPVALAEPNLTAVAPEKRAPWMTTEVPPAGRVDDRCEELTKTEYALLEMFMASPGRLFSPAEIYAHVWKAERPDRTLLYVYIGYLRRRLRDAGARALIHTVPGSGYVMQDPADPNIATPHGSSF